MNCCRQFREYDVWFLHNTDKFINRKLYLGRCPVCKTDIALLIEERIVDNKIFSEKGVGHKRVDNICSKIRHHIAFTQQDIKIRKGKPCGWIYGENTEIHNKKGEVVEIRQKACDYYGQKEIIKSIACSSLAGAGVRQNSFPH